MGPSSSDRQPPDFVIDLRQYEGVGNTKHRAGLTDGRSGYPNEIPLQGYGYARMGRCERQRVVGMA